MVCWPPAGLCGNFNDVMADDFRVMSGLVEGTAAAFANTWKTRAQCPDAKTRRGHPCAQGITNGRTPTSVIALALSNYLLIVCHQLQDKLLF